MFKRLSIVALNTGISQLIALVSIGCAARIFDASIIGQIGIIESSTILIISMISFGLQLATNRNIVISKNWSLHFEQGQKARITMSVILLPAGFLYWFTGDMAYLLFFISPIIALNGDYALYGRGFPEYASRVSFYRVLIPSAILIIGSMMHSKQIVSFYAIGMVSGVFIAGYLASLKLNTRYFFSPKVKSLKYYFDSFKLGIGSVSLTVMGSGLILISNHFYTLETVGEAYLGIKLFIIYKGVRRIIIQAFFSELKEPSNALMVDRLNIVIGIFGGTLFIYYPNFVITIFYGDGSIGLSNVIQLVGIAILFSSITSVAGITILLSKMDTAYFITNLFSMIISLLTVILASIILPNSSGILAGVIIGEVSLFFFFAYFLGFFNFFYQRLKIFFGNSLILVIPPICIYMFENRIIETGLSLFLVLISLAFKNKIILNWKKNKYYDR